MTLFERLAGQGPSSEKIPIHGFIALLVSVNDGDITLAEARTVLGLDTAQAAQALALFQAMQAHPRPREFIEWLFRMLVLAELGYLPEKYRSEAAFTARVQAEISRGAT